MCDRRKEACECFETLSGKMDALAKCVEENHLAVAKIEEAVAPLTGMLDDLAAVGRVGTLIVKVTKTIIRPILFLIALGAAVRYGWDHMIDIITKR